MHQYIFCSVHRHLGFDRKCANVLQDLSTVRMCAVLEVFMGNLAAVSVPDPHSLRIIGIGQSFKHHVLMVAQQERDVFAFHCVTQYAQAVRAAVDHISEDVQVIILL